MVEQRTIGKNVEKRVAKLSFKGNKGCGMSALPEIQPKTAGGFVMRSALTGRGGYGRNS